MTMADDDVICLCDAYAPHKRPGLCPIHRRDRTMSALGYHRREVEHTDVVDRNRFGVPRVRWYTSLRPEHPVTTRLGWTFRRARVRMWMHRIDVLGGYPDKLTTKGYPR